VQIPVLGAADEDGEVRNLFRGQDDMIGIHGTIRDRPGRAPRLPPRVER
jgi:hypothetical protein